MSDLIETVADAFHKADLQWTADNYDFARAAITAIEAAGFVIAPREPTEAMLKALNDMAVCAGYVEEGYAAMLRAVPKVTHE